MVIVRSALQNFRKRGRSPRIWVLALLMLVFANNPARALCQAAEESGKALPPWLLPFLFHRRAHRNPRLSARIQRVEKSALSASLTGRSPESRARSAMEAVGLDWRSRKHVDAYSLGMRQRLGLAQAILDDPEILILDEPMNGLDHAAIAEFRELLRRLAEQGKNIVLASHYQEDLRELCRTVYQMDGGRLVSL